MGALSVALVAVIASPVRGEEPPPTDAEAYALLDRAFQNLYADDYVQGLWAARERRVGLLL
jgi:hypothetical protein